MHKAQEQQIERTDVLLQLKELVLKASPLKGSIDQIQDHANLYNDWLDSTSVVALVLNIEEFFEIDVTAEEIEIELFQDLGKLTDLIMEILLREAPQVG